MAKFAQYHLEFILDNLFAQPYKTERQKYFGALLENKESIKFTMETAMSKLPTSTRWLT